MLQGEPSSQEGPCENASVGSVSARGSSVLDGDAATDQVSHDGDKNEPEKIRKER